MMVEFQKNIMIKGTIVCETGLHIGSTRGEMSIGGVEVIVIVDPKTGRPVIPGSSLKGKIRSLLELKDRMYSSDGQPHGHKQDEKCEDPNCRICIVFGGSETKIGPTRLIVRDMIMDELPELELKTENVINRLTGKAEHPRTIERVPKGSTFVLDMIYGVYNIEDLNHLKTVFDGMALLEDSYLGASGSRGYGKVRFEKITFKVKTKADYQNGIKEEREPVTIVVDGAEKKEFTVNEVLLYFDKIKEKIEKTEN
jgi:CRISPR-associated protein Csm3